MTKLERLTTYRISKGYKTAKAFAELLNLSASQISEVNKKDNPANLLLALKTKTDLNLNWLLTGEGEMLNKVEGVMSGNMGLSSEELMARYHEALDAQEKADIFDQMPQELKPFALLNPIKSRILAEAAKMSEAEQKELLKRMSAENIEKGRY